MEDHEHKEVTYLTHVRLPYRLTYAELELDPAARGVGISEAINQVQGAQLNDDELGRVLIGAALLINTGKNYAVGECLETALIWERG
jgi:hypothetical protein